MSPWRYKIDLKGWRATLALNVLVLLCAMGAVAVTAGFGVAGLAFARLFGADEKAAHFVEYLASGSASGALVAFFFALGRWSREQQRREEEDAFS